MEEKGQIPVHAERGSKEVHPDFFRQYTDYAEITQEMAERNKEGMRRKKKPTVQTIISEQFSLLQRPIY